MRVRWHSLLTLCAAPLVAACGGDVVATNGGAGGGATTTTTGTVTDTTTTTTTGTVTDTTTSTTGTTTTGTTTTTTTGPVPSGDCATDTDCPEGACVELTPGGWRACTRMPPEAVACTQGPVPDQCCTSAECDTGRCYSSTTMPHCGGMPPPDYNACFADTCQTDEDCIHDNPDPWACLPAGAFGMPVRTCFPAFCHTNADCTAQPGGACRPIANPCCGTPSAIACVYPGGCAADADCASDGSTFCDLDRATGTGVCVPGPVACPA